MNAKKIYITETDLQRLQNLIRESLEITESQRIYMRHLAAELQKAEIVDPVRIPPYVVTMNSIVKLKDLDTGESLEYTLVYPGFSNPEEGKISVLAPIGTALLGYQEGSVIEWLVPSGQRRLKIEQILYQPESMGSFEL